MFEIIGLIIFGFFVGTYGTLIGIGGGPLIVPFLLLCYRIPPTDIIATSLCVVFFNVVSGSLAYYKQKRIDIISGTKFGIATIPGAIVGTYIPQFFSAQFLRILFGILLFLLAMYVIFSKEKSSTVTQKSTRGNYNSKNMVTRVIIDAEENKYVYRVNEKLGLLLSAKIGIIATTLGIGGGVIHVPMLTRVMNFPVHIATATAHYQLFICTLFGLIFYIHMDYVHFGIAIPMAIGAVCGARLGAGLSRNLTGKNIFSYLAVALLIMVIRLLFWEIK